MVTRGRWFGFREPDFREPEMKKILCLDFDGVLHLYTSPWVNATTIPDGPVAGAREFLENAIERFRVCVFSSRSSSEVGRIAMKFWCRDHFGSDIADALEFPVNKPPATVTLDDRAMTFDGVWPDLDEIQAFTPWNKRRQS